jgi:hypothetical protein
LGLACAGLIGDAPLAAARARIMRPPGSSSRTHPSARLYACLVLWQIGCRGGRVASSHQRPLHLCGRLKQYSPKRAWSEWARHIGIASCARCSFFWPLPCARGAAPNSSMETLLRYATWWRVPRPAQDVKHRRCIKEKHNLSMAETLSENRNTRAHGKSSHQGLIRFCRTATHSPPCDNKLAPNRHRGL